MNKTLMIVTLVIGLAVAVYFMFFRGRKAHAATSEVSNGAGNPRGPAISPVAPQVEKQPVDYWYGSDERDRHDRGVVRAPPAKTGTPTGSTSVRVASSHTSTPVSAAMPGPRANTLKLVAVAGAKKPPGQVFAVSGSPISVMKLPTQNTSSASGNRSVPSAVSRAPAAAPAKVVVAVDRKSMSINAKPSFTTFSVRN